MPQTRTMDTPAGRGPGLLLVGNFLSGSRPYRLACEELATQLLRRGWDVLTTSVKANRLARLLDMLSCARRWRDRYRVAAVDVFSGPAFFWAAATCWVLCRYRKPYAITLRGGDLPGFARRWPGAVSRLLASASAVVAPSQYLIDQLAPYSGEIWLIPNGLDVAAYRGRAAQPVAPKLVWLRAFHKIYNPELAIEVVARIRYDFPDAILTMVGPDRGDGSLDRARLAARRLGVEGCVAFPGGIPKSEVPGWLQRGDIFLNTTNIDNTPTSVLEAMACGLCIVSTNVGGIPYLLEHGKDALLVEPGDANAMALAVRRLLTEPGLAQRLSRAGAEKARNMDWSVVLPRWEALFEAVMAGEREAVPC